MSTSLLPLFGNHPKAVHRFHIEYGHKYGHSSTGQREHRFFVQFSYTSVEELPYNYFLLHVYYKLK